MSTVETEAAASWNAHINLVTRAFYRSNRACNHALAALRGIFDGLWLGVLTPSRLDQIDALYYHGCGDYVSEHYNRQGLFAWEIRALDQYFEGVHRVAVTSAGGGREVIALRKAGFEAVGFEPNPELAEFGSTLLAADGGTRIEPSDRNVWPPAATGFDAAIVGWGGYMLIAGRQRRMEFLRHAAASLPAGAPILLSFFVRNRNDARFRLAAAVANLLRTVSGRRRIDIGDALVPNLVHYFTRHEIDTELADGGFEMVAFEVDEYAWAVGRKVGG